MLTVQSIQSHVATHYIGCNIVQLMWKSMLALTRHGQVDQSGSDMCHHCKGNTWNVHTADVSQPYAMWKVFDMEGIVGMGRRARLLTGHEDRQVV
jgi:hypothetical protein